MTQGLPPDGGDDERLLRRALVDADYWYLPEITGRKGTSIKDYQHLGGTFVPEQDYHCKSGVMRNTALYLRQSHALDIDVDDAATVEGILGVALECLVAPRSVRYRAGTTRLALLYRGETDGLYRAVSGSEGAVEIFNGPERKLSAFGIHTNKDTGVQTRYCWDEVPGNIRHEDLSEVTVEQVKQFLDAVKDWLGDDVRINTGQTGKSDGTGKADSLVDLYEAAKFVPDQGDHWIEWNRIGMALFRASAGDDIGLKAFEEYTERYCPHRLGRCLQRWMAYVGTPPTRIGAGTIFKLAMDNGYKKAVDPNDPFAALARRVRQQRLLTKQAFAKGKQ